MSATVAYSFLLLAIVICTIELKSRQLLHSTYKLFVFSVFLQFAGILLEAMAYLKYAVNGMGYANLKTTGLAIFFLLLYINLRIIEINFRSCIYSGIRNMFFTIVTVTGQGVYDYKGTTSGRCKHKNYDFYVYLRCDVSHSFYLRD